MAATLDNKSFTAIFSGGGTGGHLMPGLSVAEEIRHRVPGSRCVFVGTSKGLERRIVGRWGFEFVAVPSAKLKGSALSTPRRVARMAGGLMASRRLMRRLRPDVVVSLGGYAAFAPCLAGLLGNVPLAVMEQNALPGKANRLLSWWAQEVYVPWPGMEGRFAYPERVRVTGNPVRRSFFTFKNADLLDPGDSACPRRGQTERSALGARRLRQRLATEFGLNPHKRTLLVMGGSQGAVSINRAVAGALPLLEPEASWLQILHSTGDTGFEDTLRAYEASGIQSAVHPFIEDMASAYAVSDLALCRAGGTTVAELTALGVPAVLVPLPIAANDHQRRNASLVAGEGAALLVDQADMAPASLAMIVTRLMKDEEHLKRMRSVSLRLGRPAAARSVAERLLDFVKERRSAAPMSAPTAQELEEVFDGAP